MYYTDKLNKYMGNYPFPDYRKAKKDSKKYYKGSVEAIYSAYMKNKTGISYFDYDNFKLFREYGRGMQSEYFYKTYLKDTDTDASPSVVNDTDGNWNVNREYNKKGWGNMKFNILSPAPKIRSQIHGLFDDFEFDIMADTIDAQSGAEKETQKSMLWAQARNLKFMNNFKIRAGIPLEQETFIPSSMEELELYEITGGFKSNYASALEEVIKHTMNISDWRNLKKKI